MSHNLLLASFLNRGLSFVHTYCTESLHQLGQMSVISFQGYLLCAEHLASASQHWKYAISVTISTQGAEAHRRIPIRVCLLAQLWECPTVGG